MITCELRLLLTDSRLACEDEGCLTTINLKETGEGVGLCQIAKHLNLTHGVNHTPLRRSRTQDDCFITDLAWSVASQILLLGNRIVLLLTPQLFRSYCTFETLPLSLRLCNILVYFYILSHLPTLTRHRPCSVLSRRSSISLFASVSNKSIRRISRRISTDMTSDTN